ncbi:hypothetical protein SEA_FRANSOYER_95 [Microbacterium phage Fransoyer]|nr:hypothetical protein SEA_FRANSOYER_95 [Microbacterium phage Fransoyer]
MSAHETCAAPGKYDCDVDAYVFNAFGLEGDPGEGHVSSPSAWFAGMVLDDASFPEREAATHYGARFLVLREFNDGRCVIEWYATAEMQEERLAVLRAAYEEWDPSPLSDSINLG